MEGEQKVFCSPSFGFPNPLRPLLGVSRATARSLCDFGAALGTGAAIENLGSPALKILGILY